MFWADELVDEIIKKQPSDSYWVDDMKTPSGRIHTGALCGIVYHGLIHQLLMEKGKKSTYSYVFNDMDPMDGFPQYLPEEFRQYMGRPLFKVPSPQKGFGSLAECYAKEFQTVFESLGFKPKVLWSSQMYEEGKFDEVIRTALDKVEKVRHLYHEVSDYDKPKNWYPFQVICPECGQVGSTIVTGWDGEKVEFECRPNLVNWCQGCGTKGKISPFGGTGKLMWKTDWAAHWKVIGVTVEGAGKDHMTEGGSYDLSSALCEQVFDRKAPFGFLYEWFLAKGGKKMSSSKGVGVSAREVSETLPPEILRFLIAAGHYRQSIIFDPTSNETILDLFDRYDRCARAYWEKGDEKEARAFDLSQPGAVPDQMFLPRFRELTKIIQDPKTKLEVWAEQKKGDELNKAELAELKKRAKYAKIWLEKYAPDQMILGMTEKLPEEAKKLTKEQKEFLIKLINLLGQDWPDPEELQTKIFETAKGMGLGGKPAFGAIYLSLIGKQFGPKAAWFILDIGVDKVIARFKEAIK